VESELLCESPSTIAEEAPKLEEAMPIPEETLPPLKKYPNGGTQDCPVVSR
jgi:hypothetical protein